MKADQLYLAFREAGEVRRAHTVPFSNSYNIASHSYNALNLLLILYPGTPSHNLIKSVLWHDVPERWTGDVPAPAKWASPFLKNILDSLEQQIFKKLNIEEIFIELTPQERDWLRAVDLLELLIWSEEQISLGNVAAKDINKRVRNLLTENSPKKVKKFIKEFKWQRLPECDEFLGRTYGKG